MRTLILVIVSLYVSAAYGQQSGFFPPPQEPPKIVAIKANGDIRIDGVLDETDWQSAQATTDFFRIEPRQGGSYKYHNSVKVLYDEKNIYFGVWAADSLIQSDIRVQDLRRDFKWGENDVFAIQLDPQNLKQYCVSFQTTPYGSQRDLQVFNGSNTDNDWNALWVAKTTRTADGYFAEFAIPFKTLRYDTPTDGVSPSWGITLMRLTRREYEQTVYPPIPRPFSPYRMTYAGQLVGLELPPPSTNIRIEPYVSYNYDYASSSSDPATNQKAKIGGDIKWAITPRSVLDLTVNTDFAQADVDRAVNNLERFNIFFPERRQFFLENSGLWAGAKDNSIVPYFSRRIGLRGNFNAEPAPIDVGTRFTSRSEKQAIAAMYVHQAATDDSPAANFAVGRYLRNYGKENNVGVMLTHRLDEQSKSLNTSVSNNTTLTLDGLIRHKGRLTISYMLSGSRDGSSDTLGLAGRFFTGYKADNFYAGWVSKVVTQDYRPDMGFVFQRNVIHHSPGGYYIWRPKNISWIRRWDPGFFAHYYHDADDPSNFQQSNIFIFPVYIQFTNGSFLQYGITPTWQNINFNFAPLGITIDKGSYQYTRQKIKFNTDQSAKLSVSGEVDWGKFYSGSRTTLTGGIRYAPSVHAAFTLDYEHNILKDLGNSMQDLKTHLVSAGSRLALNPKLQLSALYQYNSFGKQGRWNVRCSWEYQPLSFLYLVYNSRAFEQLERPMNDRQFIAKLTYIKQF